MSVSKKKKGKRKDKFDQNIIEEGMGTVDNEGVSEETGINKGKKRDKKNSGDGIEEFSDDNKDFGQGDDDEP